MNFKLPTKAIVSVMIYASISTAALSTAALCYEIEITEKLSEVKGSNTSDLALVLDNAQLNKKGKTSMTAFSKRTVNLVKDIPDGFYEVVGHKSGNEQNIAFGGFTTELETLGNTKGLSKNPLIFSRWEDAEVQRYYPYSYSILWEKSGDILRWHIYMNHTGNAQTGHPAFRAYFETVGKLSGDHLINMTLVKGSENSLFLQENAYGRSYDFNDITSRTAKSKHMATYSKFIQWGKVKKENDFGTLYEFTEVNTAEDIATIAAQEASDGVAVPIGFGSIRHLLVGSIHAELTYVVRKVDKGFFEESVKAGKAKSNYN